MPTLPPILTVDDDPDALFFLRRLLVKGGVENKVVAFEDALAAMDYLERESLNPDPLFIPCAVITDMRMPGKNGLEFTRWVRAHPRLDGIPIIMLTDSDEARLESEAVASGVTRFLRKFPGAQSLRVTLDGIGCFKPRQER